MRYLPCALLLAAGVLAPASLHAQAAVAASDAAPAARAPRNGLEREIRRELVTLPFYNIFDNLTFQVQGRTVVLAGQVYRPTTKSSAERVVKDIEGVERVVNNIEVLPLSPNDDRIRIATFQAIYGHPALQRYGFQAVGPIHIIVRNGHVTLEGVVANDADRNIANVRANGVAGVFSVTNNLRTDKEMEDGLMRVPDQKQGR